MNLGLRRLHLKIRWDIIYWKERKKKERKVRMNSKDIGKDREREGKKETKRSSEMG